MVTEEEKMRGEKKESASFVHTAGSLAKEVHSREKGTGLNRRVHR